MSVHKASSTHWHTQKKNFYSVLNVGRHEVIIWIKHMHAYEYLFTRKIKFSVFWIKHLSAVWGPAGGINAGRAIAPKGQRRARLWMHHHIMHELIIIWVLHMQLNKKNKTYGWRCYFLLFQNTWKCDWMFQLPVMVSLKMWLLNFKKRIGRSQLFMALQIISDGYPSTSMCTCVRVQMCMH